MIHAQPSNFSDFHINETHVTFIESEEIELDSLEVDQPVKVCLCLNNSYNFIEIKSVECQHNFNRSNLSSNSTGIITKER